MKTPIFLATALLILPGVSTAATLANYAFANGPNTLPTVNGVTATAISYGSGLGTPQTSAATFGPSGASALGLVTASAAPTTIPAAVSANSFFTFTLTSSPGTSFLLTDFTFWANYSGDTTAANELALQIDTGSGYQTIGTSTFNVTGSAAPGKMYTIPINNPAPVDGSAHFRIVMFDSAGINWTSFTRMDDLSVNGTVIPEPSAWLLMLCVGGLVPLHRRRSH
ncbi:MAG: hypothetical protein KF712_03915 [Akkermansiaceae bacterium]|nr:hypothetical protein [Akkermansiaceae bacterium]